VWDDPAVSSLVERVSTGVCQRAFSSAAVGGLPFRADGFDAVISCCALEHWPDPAAGIAECVRVARPAAPIDVIEVDGATSEEEFNKSRRQREFRLA
jgi:ubiquinone/menaquinone biosynthesis C-methylase UbiE